MLVPEFYCAHSSGWKREWGRGGRESGREGGRGRKKSDENLDTIRSACVADFFFFFKF